MGKGVLKAVSNVNNIIADNLSGILLTIRPALMQTDRTGRH